MDEEYSDKKMEKILTQIRKWGKEFSKTKYFEELTGEEKQESQFVLETFAEYMYSHHGSSPEEWDEGDLEECCLETLPRKISTDEIYLQSIAPVLCAFFAFAEERNLLKNAATLAKRVRAIDKQIVKNASNPEQWGISKSLVRAAEDAGVDVMDEGELSQFITHYNERILSQPRDVPRSEPKVEPVHVGAKVGRNEPCPCGSGKKYKKCCGR